MAKHGYEQVKIDEIRRILKEKYGIDDERLGGTKTALVMLLLEKEREAGNEVPEMSEEDVAAVFDAAEEEEEKIDVDGIADVDIPETQPAFNSDEWQDYVMRQFHERELENGQPTCVGCNRVAQLLLGLIVNRHIVAHTPPSVANNGTATVVYGIDILITNESHVAHGNTIHCEDIADVNARNTDHPYHKYPSPTAATRAEGRILRKLLGLNRTTAEETSKVAEEEILDEGWKPREPIEDHQINTINTLCERLNIDVIGLINSGSKQYPQIEMVSKETAGTMIQFLNSVQQDKKPKPDDIGCYNRNWRNT